MFSSSPTETYSVSLAGFLTLCYRLVVRSADVKIVSAVSATNDFGHTYFITIYESYVAQSAFGIKFVGSFAATYLCIVLLQPFDGSIRIQSHNL